MSISTLKNLFIATTILFTLSGCASDLDKYSPAELTTNLWEDVKSDLGEEKKPRAWKVKHEGSRTFSSAKAIAFQDFAFELNDHAFAEGGENALNVMDACHASKNDALSYQKAKDLKAVSHELIVGCLDAMMNYPVFDGRFIKKDGSKGRKYSLIQNIKDNLDGLHEEFEITEEDGLTYKY